MTWMMRQAIKVPLSATGMISQSLQAAPKRAEYLFLIYHRVDGGLGLELDMSPSVFRRQIALLASTGRVIRYEQAVQDLVGGTDGCGISYVLTFDDGYKDFYSRVFPLLRETGLPAMLFVTTGFVEEGKAYPLLSVPDADVDALTWDMLGEMAESGLVSIGAHTHTHPVLSTASVDEIEEELARPLDLFMRELGIRPVHFAYPRAETNSLVRSLTAQYYDSAASGGGGRATADGFDRYNVPRIPIRRSDGWCFFQAKLRGWLEYEEPMYALMRAWTGRTA